MKRTNQISKDVKSVSLQTFSLALRGSYSILVALIRHFVTPNRLVLIY